MTLGIRRRQPRAPRPRLVDVARPAEDGSGYDYAAIARALSPLERQALAELAAEAPVTYAGAARRLVEAGLAIAGSPPVLSMLGEAVVEIGLRGLFDG